MQVSLFMLVGKVGKEREERWQARYVVDREYTGRQEKVEAGFSEEENSNSTTHTCLSMFSHV